MKQADASAGAPMGFWARAAVIVGLLLAQACVMPAKFSETTKVDSAEPIELKRLYVYSFLDVRSKELGEGMMSEIEAQFGARLKELGIETEQHWFNRSPVVQGMARVSGTERVPVIEVIEGNAKAESAFAAPYRLVAFPRQTTLSGAWYYYDFEWTLFETASGRQVWSTKSSGSHMNWAKQDENPAGRAKTIVDGVVSEMVKSGLLGSSAAAQEVARTERAAKLAKLEKACSKGLLTPTECDKRRAALDATATPAAPAGP